MLKLFNFSTHVSFHSMLLEIQLLQIIWDDWRYGVRYKPLSYHDVREKLLKQAVKKVDLLLQKYRDEWKRIS